jgi:hypothetical protein
MKNEIRRGRMPVIDTTDTAVNKVGRETPVKGKGGAIEEDGGVTMRLNEEEKEEEDDVFKRMFSNDRLVKCVMRFL